MCIFSARGLCSTEHSSVFVCLFVCVRHKNEHFERNRAVYELHLLHTSQKSKNIHASRTRAYFGKPRKADFSVLLKLLFNIGDLYQKNDYYHSAAHVVLSVGDRNSG